ncbi:holo-ACP synthase [Candidatus Nitrosotenuis aquarius]|uniref:holo-ACP synthase n=1 Tax=Candidatus Nitrosotenuis aquarius TaxID=1846278 RepID=UPI001FE3BF14|nr:holo-ACP synthase [Candidatus Nitrosotenuis aquarius]
MFDRWFGKSSSKTITKKTMLENFGIGIDIVDVQRFEKIKFQDKPTFYKKLFCQSEIKYCLKYKNPAQHFAGKFACKEALKKSIKKQISFLDVETSHHNSRPVIRLHNTKLGKYRFLVSISHEKEFAVAVVISEKI